MMMDRSTERPKRSRGHISTPAAPSSTITLSERRRQRRTKREGVPDPQQAAPRSSGSPLRIYVSPRWISSLVVVALLFVLYIFLSRDIFFINVIYVGGVRYLSSGEIFQRSELARMHIFWVDPAEVRQRLIADPSIADANIDIGWPPNMVQISITEREPALIWQQANQQVWVDVQGRVMALRRDAPGLIRVVVKTPSKIISRGPCPLQGMDEVLGPGSCIDPKTVAGALQFKALYPNVEEIVYDPRKGLGFADGRGWMLWFGDGTDLSLKMTINDQLVREIYTEQRRQFVEINLVDPDRPYYSLAPVRR